MLDELMCLRVLGRVVSDSSRGSKGMVAEIWVLLLVRRTCLRVFVAYFCGAESWREGVEVLMMLPSIQGCLHSLEGKSRQRRLADGGDIVLVMRWCAGLRCMFEGSGKIPRVHCDIVRGTRGSLVRSRSFIGARTVA